VSRPPGKLNIKNGPPLFDIILAIRNASSFDKLVKCPYFEHFLKISCNFKILSGQNISSGEKTRKLDTCKTLSNNEK